MTTRLQHCAWCQLPGLAIVASRLVLDSASHSGCRQVPGGAGWTHHDAALPCTPVELIAAWVTGHWC